MMDWNRQKSRTLCATLLLGFAQTSFALPGWSKYTQVAGVGWNAQGAGLALGTIDNNPRPDLVLMAYDNPSGQNSFRYKIGWNLNGTGQAASWSNKIQVPGVSWEAQGADVALANLDGNSRPELILVAYDSPSKQNRFRYRIGWNLDAAGKASSWSSIVNVPGLGWEGSGASVAFVNLDGNSRPEMVLMAYDAPDGANEFRYRVGWNVDVRGKASSWSGGIKVPGVGWEGQGAGVAFTNLDGDGRPEMILMAYDNPDGANSFRYRVGWDVGTAGKATSWSGAVRVSGVGAEGQGADLALYDLDGNGQSEMLLMAYDNPARANTFRYIVGTDMMVVDDFLVTLSSLGHSDYKQPTKIPDSASSQTAANLYQLSDPIVLHTGYEAIQEYVNDCHSNPGAHSGEVDNPSTITFFDVLNDPDAMVAAVAWFVDENMRWSDDATNKRNLDANYSLNYDPGWDYPIPANYTIRYTGENEFGNVARFHGDCEDHAILRAALLRSLGFNPEHIWNVLNNPLSHEYNLVAYRGALRVMDYGPIGKWLANDRSGMHRTYYGYSETHSVRGYGSSQHEHLKKFGNNYPGGAPACGRWDSKNYYREICP